MVNYIKKLPERQKDPETCCASVKEGGKYINPVGFNNDINSNCNNLFKYKKEK